MSRPMTIRPKFVTVYERLFQSSPAQLTALDEDQYWLDVFSMDLDKPWLSGKLQRLSHEDCLGRYKPLLNLLFRRSLCHFQRAKYDDPTKNNCLEIMIQFVLVGLSKQLSGWEVMDLFAGGVGMSDTLFSDFTGALDEILGDDDAPVEIRHRTLQLALAFACSINQLSPGAYFLRRDLYPSLVAVILSPRTQQFTFEATLLLSVLSNFHKSDAAKTNPYLNRIRASTDADLMKKISWVIAFATQRASNAYQEISDDSPPTLVTTFGSFMSSLRPDRALSSTPIDPPRELFKNQPIEAAVMLLPLYDFLCHNERFRHIFVSSLSASSEQPETAHKKPSLPHSVLSFSSYLVTHASSTSSSRALAYAHLALAVLLICVEDQDIVHAFYQPPPDVLPEVRLCRQRQPHLPLPPSRRPLICALLDCCVLWLRHNLHRRLDVLSYITCVRILRRAIRFATVERIRLEYHWEELWRSLLLVLNFVNSQIGSLKSITKADDLLHEATCLLHFSIHFGEHFLPTAKSLHQLVYEIVRSASTFAKQTDLLKSLKGSAKRQSVVSPHAEELVRLQRIAGHYEEKLVESKAQSAEAVMRLISSEVDREGIFGIEEQGIEDLPRYSDDVVDIAFARWACADGLALMKE